MAVTRPSLDAGGGGYSPPIVPQPATAAKPAPVVTTPIAKPATTNAATMAQPKSLSYKDMSQSDSDWYNAYSRSIVNGTADHLGLQKYQDFSKKYGLKQHEISQDQLHQLSIKALSGDLAAQEYLKNMKLNSQTGSALWTGVTHDQLNGNEGLRNAYLKDNPYSDFAQMYKQQQQANDPIYQALQAGLKDRYNPDDPNDPFNQYRNILQQNQQGALNAQDVMLNNSFQQMDANSFQQFEQLQQIMADRGMGDSGIAADAYMRAQMGNNQNYQQAFAESANTKANIKQQYAALTNDNNMAQRAYGDSRNDLVYDRAVGQQSYNDAKSWQEKTYAEGKATDDQRYADDKAYRDKAYADSRLDAAYARSVDRRDYNDAQKDKADAKKAAEEKAKIDALNNAIKNQSERDKYLTVSTGRVYLDGKVLRDANGQVIPSMEMQKLMETNRHNQTNESISAANAQTNAKNAQTNAQNANTNAMNAQTKRDKALADVAAKVKDLEIKQGTLDLKTNDYNLKVAKFNKSVDEALVNINNKTATQVVNNKKREAKDLLAQANKIKVVDKATEKARQKILDQYYAKNKEIEAELAKYKTLEKK